MNTRIKSLLSMISKHRYHIILPVITLAIMLTISVVLADVPARVGVRGTVPNPGTQQQELGNITFPAPFNVFEFLVTCAACHGGTIDQQAGHFGNWSGTSMASAARDPVFRANQMIVNETVQALTGKDGAGNLCMRCHSPNGWYSGRFDPTMGGAADGSTMIHSILASTDDEGIMCETCHRTLGAVTYKRSDLNPMDQVWNMLAGIGGYPMLGDAGWPHDGGPYVDQDGDPTIATGNPYGDMTLQIDDGMTYGARYPGYVKPFWSDIPLVPDPLGPGGYSPGGPYTGQTYAVYPQGWLDPAGNDVGGQPAFNPDGSLPIQLDMPIGPPTNPDGSPCYTCQSVSLEHPTFGVSFVEQPEFCGACHDLTIPVLNHGMPEQRTFTEWKFSAFSTGPDAMTCQSCHMPRLSHEYSDAAPVSLNADPVVSGWFPYAKSRVNTAFHKLAGANRDLPKMMSALYPEVDFEVIGGAVEGGGGGGGTGNDTRIFPGMLSNRDPMWQRNERNTEISLLDGVDVQITQAPVRVGTTADGLNGIWEVQVQVTNQTGHRIPSGYPDGRRLWIELNVMNGATPVYQSGYYNEASAMLFTNLGSTSLNRARSPLIDATTGTNAVMIYERVTGTCQPPEGAPTSCTPSLNLTNDTILFDNRIPPLGFNYEAYRNAGVKFWNYDPVTFVPYEEYDSITSQPTRYPAGQNFDVITYRFVGPLDPLSGLSAKAEAYWQTHTREFMEHLRANDTSTVRPEGPVRVWAANYPLTPNYLSDEFGLAEVVARMQADGWLLPGETLNDNWGGIAYAAWYETGKGEPYLVGADANMISGPPAPPTGVVTFVLDPFTVDIRWDPVVDADGYLVWIKYGLGATTASWDKLGIVYDDGDPLTPLSLVNTAMNVAKSYQVKVQAFNGKGYSADSAVITFTTPMDLPLPPEALMVTTATPSLITLVWTDVADNEIGFVIERQDVPVIAGFYEVARILTQTPAFGANTWTDTAVMPGRCYNYRVAAYNNSGMSIWNINGPVQGCTAGAPSGPISLIATAVNAGQVDLTWSGATGQIDGYRVQRSTDGGLTWPVTFNVPNPFATGYSDLTVAPQTAYVYRVYAYNLAGSSPASNLAPVTTPSATPAAPSGLLATPSVLSPDPPFVTITWLDNANNETGFALERSLDVLPRAWAVVDGAIPQSGGAGATLTYVDTTVGPKTTYWYRVRAFNTFGPSQYSNEDSATTPGEIPQAPSGLSISDVTRNSIRTRWIDNADNETGYEVQRSLDGGATWSPILPSLAANATTYNDRNLARNTRYCYQVRAFNADGESAFAAPVCATTRR